MPKRGRPCLRLLRFTRNDIFLTRHRERSVAIPAIEVGAACMGVRTPIFGIAAVALLLRNDGVRYPPGRVVLRGVNITVISSPQVLPFQAMFR